MLRFMDDNMDANMDDNRVPADQSQALPSARPITERLNFAITGSGEWSAENLFIFPENVTHPSHWSNIMWSCHCPIGPISCNLATVPLVLCHMTLALSRWSNVTWPCHCPIVQCHVTFPLSLWSNVTWPCCCPIGPISRDLIVSYRSPAIMLFWFPVWWAHCNTWKESEPTGITRGLL